MKEKKPLIVSLLISLGTGALSALLTHRAMKLYDMTLQPPLSPPDWVFPVVWTILFALMGVAAWRIWRTDAPEREEALVLYGVQLAFNLVWSLIFFNARRFGFALIWLAALWGLILATVRRFYRLDRTAGRLMVPYLVWVTFAAYLNAGVWWLNR